MASSTGCSSFGEREMTPSTSRRRGLVLERLRQLLRARLHLLEEADVVDGDDGLVGEGGDEVDLALGEGAHLVRASAMTPIGSPSRNSGTPSMVRGPTDAHALVAQFSGSASTSAMCMVLPSMIARGRTNGSRSGSDSRS